MPPTQHRSAPAAHAGRAELIPECVALWMQAVRARDGDEPHGGVVERVAEKFTHPVIRFAILEDADGLVGFALTTILRDDSIPGHPHRLGYLELLAVDERSAGRGIGRTLLNDAVLSARTHGLERFELDVRQGNDRAIQLYESIGMSVLGEPSPHPLGGHPLVTFTLALSPATGPLMSRGLRRSRVQR